MADFADQTFGGLISITPSTGTAPALSAFSLNATTAKVIYIFQAKGTSAITDLGVMYGVRTGTPPQYKIGLQGVTGGGAQDGVYKGGGSPASTLWTPPADASIDNTWQWKTLDNSYTPGNGEWLSLVLEYASGTNDVSNFSSINATVSNISARTLVPYCIQTASRQTSLPVFGVKSSTVTGFPMTATNAVSHSSTDSPNEYALAFNLPSTWVTTYTVKGFRFWGTSPAAAKTLTLQLYDGTTVLQNMTWDSDVVQASASAERFIELFFDESTLSTLNGGTTYRVCVSPGQTATNFAVRTIVVPSTNEWKAWSGGANYWLSTRSGAAWTDTLTERVMGEVIVGDFTQPSGGGGSASMLGEASWTGGFNG